MSFPGPTRPLKAAERVDPTGCPGDIDIERTGGHVKTGIDRANDATARVLAPRGTLPLSCGSSAGSRESGGLAKRDRAAITRTGKMTSRGRDLETSYAWNSGERSSRHLDIYAIRERDDESRAGAYVISRRDLSDQRRKFPRLLRPGMRVS